MCIHIAGSIPWKAAGGAAVQHQPPGEKVDIDCNNVTITSMLVAQWLRQLANMHEVIGSSHAVIHTFDFV